jgi:putative PIN family toxin of toxin-antitoxin system
LLVFDPNVFVSAFISPRRAAPAMLVEAFLEARIEVAARPLLIEEFADVVARPKFARHAADGRGHDFVATVSDHVVSATDPAVVAAVTDDPDDDYLVALAREHGAAAIVSGDRHLLDAAGVGVPVWNPRAALSQLGLDS